MGIFILSMQLLADKHGYGPSCCSHAVAADSIQSTRTEIKI